MFSDYGQKFLLTTGGKDVIINAQGRAMPAEVDFQRAGRATDLLAHAASRIPFCNTAAELNTVLLRVYAHARELAEEVCVDKRDELPYIYLKEDGSLVLKKYKDLTLPEAKDLLLP